MGSPGGEKEEAGREGLEVSVGDGGALPGPRPAPWTYVNCSLQGPKEAPSVFQCTTDSLSSDLGGLEGQKGGGRAREGPEDTPVSG